ncbi:MAG: glycosyltransferase family 39 protein [Verrucomicrobia bacterium]|nr:glycosyltransferase family 39 protein [Verrucomicrobiota bacterium]
MALKRVAAWLLRSPRGAGVLVVLVALVLRLSFAVWYVGVGQVKHAMFPWSRTDGPAQRVLDPDGYTVHAMGMISDEPHWQTSRQPLVPAYHALVFLSFGQHPTLFYNRLVDVVLAAFGCGAVYLLARRVFGQRVGLIAGLLAATSISMIHKSGYIYSETLSVPLYTLALYFFVGFADGRRWRDLVLGGVFLGLATLGRQTTYPMIYVLPLWLWLVYGRINRAMLVRSAALVGIAVAIILPWALHLSTANGQLTPVSGHPWQLLCGCYGPAQFEQPLGHFEGSWLDVAECGLFSETEVTELDQMGEVEQEAACKRRFLEYLPAIWPRIPELMLYRAIVFIGPSSRSGLFSRAFQAQQTVFFALFLGGLWMSRAHWRRLSILYLAYLCFGVLMIMLLYGSSRNRLYSDPIILAFAAAFLVWVFERRFVRKRAEQA